MPDLNPGPYAATVGSTAVLSMSLCVHSYGSAFIFCGSGSSSFSQKQSKKPWCLCKFNLKIWINLQLLPSSLHFFGFYSNISPSWIRILSPVSVCLSVCLCVLICRSGMRGSLTSLAICPLSPICPPIFKMLSLEIYGRQLSVEFSSR